MLVPLGRAPTWRLYTFRWNCLPNNAAMKNRTDLNLGDVVCLSIIYHIPDSWLNLLNDYDVYFRCKPLNNRQPSNGLKFKVVLWSNFYSLIFWAYHVEFLERLKTPCTVCKYLHYFRRYLSLKNGYNMQMRWLVTSYTQPNIISSI